ncbi:response regulator [Ohtaekwangia sp.]|uniref:response regulator n=1 Tax=Ohtaekwangia sp. TaxID=2066019 RepID=UPI002F9527E4
MRKKILIAEDDADIRLILNMLLEDAGYSVEVLPQASRIVEGKYEAPDLFIIDKDMPFIDGLAVCKYLRLKENTRHIPIIMISAHHYLKDRAKTVGVDEFIEKPFGIRSLLTSVEKCIHNDNVVNC